MKLKDMILSKETFSELQKYMIERMMNLGMATRQAGGGSAECLMAEICGLEMKIDALMALLEERGQDFSNFDQHCREAAIQGRAAAVSLREQMKG